MGHCNRAKRFIAKGTPTPEGNQLMVVCRFKPPMFHAVNELAARDGVSTAEAVRRLVECGLRATLNETEPLITIELPALANGETFR